MARKWCPRCDGSFMYMSEDGEFTCLTCGWIQYRGEPLPFIRGSGEGSHSGAERYPKQRQDRAGQPRNYTEPAKRVRK